MSNGGGHKGFMKRVQSCPVCGQRYLFTNLMTRKVGRHEHTGEIRVLTWRDRDDREHGYRFMPWWRIVRSTDSHVLGCERRAASAALPNGTERL